MANTAGPSGGGGGGGKHVPRGKRHGGFDPARFLGEVGNNARDTAGNFGKGVNEVNKAVGKTGDNLFGGLRGRSRSIPGQAQSKKNNDALKRSMGK
jgi:hypothetical protein